MGSRLRADPERILECFLEVTAPKLGETKDKEEASIKFKHPLDFEDKEALKAIPRFCFPCTSKTEAVQSYTFVLTDIQGKYRFGFCRFSPKMNTCLCILSYLPWFETFYMLLNTISELQKSSEQSGLVISLLNSLMKETPPSPGSDFTLRPPGSIKEYTFKSPDTAKLPTIPENRNLTEYFAAVDPGNMIILFISMFFERRIIVTSKKLSLLTACTYGAASLLYPMHWQHMFVPIVPPHLLDYCCAPMPFLVGVHASLMPNVRRMPLDEVVILDADTNQIECPFNDIATLPPDVTANMKSMLKKTVYPIDDHVSKTFLNAMVALIGGYRDALRFKPGEQIVFDRDVFVQSRSNSMRPLLEFILQLQLFEQFISERLELLNSGKGFNDMFEEQIGLQAENHTKLKTQYQAWVKDMKRSSGAFFGKAGKTAKKGYKETKSGLKEVGKGVKSNFSHLKGNLADFREKLKGKDDDEEIGGEIKKSNSLPHIKHYTLGIKISPVGRRRAISPGQTRKAHSFKEDLLDTRNVPRRPPPSRPNPYQQAAPQRPRTCAMSVVIDSAMKVGTGAPQLEARHSAPNLSVEPSVGKLIALEGDEGTEGQQGPTSSPKSEAAETTSGSPALLDLAEALKDDNLFDGTPSGTITTESSPTPPRPVPPRRTSSGRRPRPTIPPRPSRTSRNSTGNSVSSVDDIFTTSESPPTASESLLSPLRPVSLNLLKDTMESLPPDVKEFFADHTDAPRTVTDSTTKPSENYTSLSECLTNSLPPSNSGNVETYRGVLEVSANSMSQKLDNNDPFDGLEDKRTGRETGEQLARPLNASATQNSKWVSFN